MTRKVFLNFKILLPHEGAASQVKEHLRYWPYVKAFRDSSPKVIKVRVYLGEMQSFRQMLGYKEHSLQLIRLCLSQYKVKVMACRPSDIYCLDYTTDLYLRPHYLLSDFRSFIDELDKKNF